MSDAAAAPSGPPVTGKPKAVGLDVDFHESSHTRNFKKAYSTRKLVTNRHDDLLRSGSTHQLLNRPHSMGGAGGSLLSTIPSGPTPPAPPGAAESLATEDTAEDTLSVSEGSEFSGGSFCDASGDQLADKEYLRKDLGASLHDDDLEFKSDDGMDGDGDDDDDDGLIADVKNRMKIEEDAAAADKETAS